MVHIEVINDHEAGELYRLQGNDAFRRQDYDEAIHFYGEAMNYQKNNASIYTNRAAAGLKVDNCLMAEADCTKALGLDPNNPKAFNRRGQARQRLGDIEGAIKDFTEAQKYHSDTSITENLKKCEKILQEKGASLAAERKAEEERKAREKENVNPDQIRAEAKELFKSGDYAGAAEKYTIGIDSGKLSKDDQVTFLNNRGTCFIQMKEERSALADLDAVLDMDFYNAKARLRRGITNENIEKYSKAYDDYKVLMATDPGSSQKASEGIRRLLKHFPELKQRPLMDMPPRE